MSLSASQATQTDDAEPDTAALLSSMNAVFGLSLVLTQASSPAHAVRLMTTAVPSIVPGYTAVVWHPHASADYYEQADRAARPALERLVGAGRLELPGVASCWAFPLTPTRRGEPIFLVTFGSQDLWPEKIFLLTMLAQMCGTVIVNHQLVTEAELRAQADKERDIARARAVELAASEATQRAVLEAALDAVVSIDGHARVTYANSAFEQTFGYRVDDVIGRELADVIVPPSLREAHRAGFARYLATAEPHILDERIEVAAMRADGSEFAAELAVTRTSRDGEPTFTGYLRDITERRRAQQELMASRARLVAASDAARQRVTRDLHDGSQQRFVTALINLQLAEQKWELAPDRARELLGLAISDTRRGIEDLRDIAAGIHPAILTQRGLAPAIGALASQLPIPLDVDVPDQRLPKHLEASVYFFCSEGLTNVVKHARASSASVRVEVTDGHCHVALRDDGIGGARPRSESSGLTGLRDRIGALDGTMTIESPRSGGTVLHATIPVT